MITTIYPEHGDPKIVKIPNRIILRCHTFRRSRPEKFFAENADAKKISPKRLLKRKFEILSISEAVRIMKSVEVGEENPRVPIEVLEHGNDEYMVLDGNATSFVALLAGWPHVWASVKR